MSKEKKLSSQDIEEVYNLIEIFPNISFLQRLFGIFTGLLTTLSHRQMITRLEPITLKVVNSSPEDILIKDIVLILRYVNCLIFSLKVEREPTLLKPGETIFNNPQEETGDFLKSLTQAINRIEKNNPVPLTVLEDQTSVIYLPTERKHPNNSPIPKK